MNRVESALAALLELTMFGVPVLDPPVRNVALASDRRTSGQPASPAQHLIRALCDDRLHACRSLSRLPNYPRLRRALGPSQRSVATFTTTLSPTAPMGRPRRQSSPRACCQCSRVARRQATLPTLLHTPDPSTKPQTLRCGTPSLCRSARQARPCVVRPRSQPALCARDLSVTCAQCGGSVQAYVPAYDHKYLHVSIHTHEGASGCRHAAVRTGASRERQRLLQSTQRYLEPGRPRRAVHALCPGACPQRRPPLLPQWGPQPPE